MHTPFSMKPPKTKSDAASALVSIRNVLLTAFVIATLYFARDLLIPLALAALLTFLLAPLVTRLERWIGRIAAVLLVVGDDLQRDRDGWLGAHSATRGSRDEAPRLQGQHRDQDPFLPIAKRRRV